MKTSQLKVNAKTIDSIKGGFFQSLPSNAFDLSVIFKENIANFCLVISLYLQENRKIAKRRKTVYKICGSRRV